MFCTRRGIVPLDNKNVVQMDPINDESTTHTSTETSPTTSQIKRPSRIVSEMNSQEKLQKKEHAKLSRIPCRLLEYCNLHTIFGKTVNLHTIFGKTVIYCFT